MVRGSADRPGGGEHGGWGVVGPAEQDAHRPRSVTSPATRTHTGMWTPCEEVGTHSRRVSISGQRGLGRVTPLRPDRISGPTSAAKWSA